MIARGSINFVTSMGASLVLMCAVGVVAGAQQSADVSCSMAVMTKNDVALTSLAQANGVTVDFELSSISAWLLSSSGVEDMKALLEELRALDESIECEPIDICLQTSGPSSVPIINPNGDPQLLASQSAFGLGQAMQLPPLSGVVWSPTIVAVIDTGVDGAHSGLLGRIHPASKDFLEPSTAPDDVGDGFDNDGDGVIDRAYGHGTHLAGIVAMMVPSAQVLALRAIDDEGRGTPVAVAQAVVYAVENGARVINLSLGFDMPSPMLRRAIEYADGNGVLVCISAGNETSSIPRFPATYGIGLVVGATTPGSNGNAPLWVPVHPHEAIAPFSNRDFVDCAAMGVGVKSFYPGERFARWDGTSMASAIVASTAALVLALDPVVDIAIVRSRILDSCVVVTADEPCGPLSLGAGRIRVGVVAESSLP